MRNDVNKRPKRPGDLAALLAATPPEDHDFLQGVVLTMDLATGANSVDMGGGITQSNCLVVGEPGDVPAGTVVFMVRVRRRYFILGPISAGPDGEIFRFSQRLLFTSSGSFDPDTYPGLRGIMVTSIAGGGAGGGTPATAASTRSAGGGGGAGAINQAFVPLASIANPTSYTVGSGGTGVSGGTGNTGGATFFGSGIAAASPGEGGAAGTATAAVQFVRGGNGGLPGGGLSQIRTKGQPGTIGVSTNTAPASSIGGTGGSGPYGGGGHPTSTVSQAGQGGDGYGAGGGGAQAANSSGALAGGAGRPGAIYVDIYV